MTLQKYSLLGAVGFTIGGIFAFFNANFFTALVSIICAVLISIFFFRHYQSTDDNLMKIASLVGFVAVLILMLGLLIELIGIIGVSLGILATAGAVQLTANIIFSLTLFVICVRLLVLYNSDIVMTIFSTLILLTIILWIFIGVIFPVAPTLFGIMLFYMYYKKIAL